MNNPNKQFRKSSLVWPVVLIVLGVTFLLNNLGIWSYDVWLTIIRLWPLLLIAVGIDILLGRRTGVWSAITIFLIIGLFIGGVWVVNLAGSVWVGDITSQDISIPLGDASRAEIEVTLGAGELEIGKLVDSNDLMHGVVRITENETLQQDILFDDGIAYIKLGSTGTQIYPSWLFYEREEGFKKWEFDLTTVIPVDLEIHAGVGKSTIDLAEIHLVKLNIDTGVGETIVYLPESEGYKAWVSVGVGRLIVYVPQTLNVRIHIDNALGNISISGDYIQDGSVYSSPGFYGSENWVDLFVDGGIGEVRIVQIHE